MTIASGPVAMTTNPACVPAYAGPLDFLFVVHPREIEDIFRAYPHLRGQNTASVMAAVRPHPVSVLGPISVNLDGRCLNGELISIPYLASEFRRCTREIRTALRAVLDYARARETKMVGLGALIPSVTRYGADLLPFAKGVGITSGHTFTAYALSRHVIAVEEILGGMQALAIVGAAGSIGRGTARALTAQSKDRRVLLVDVNARKQALAEMRHEFQSSGCRSVEISTNLASIKQASVIVCATNASAAIIRPSDLTPGSVIIDDSQPPNITVETSIEAEVTVLKCLASVPTLICPFDYGLFRNGDHAEKQHLVFTCLAETVMLAALQHGSEFAKGSPESKDITKIASIAEKFGVSSAPFQSFPQLSSIMHASRFVRS